ncbi:MAG: CDP-diacylglycerol--serine O-phosphatidyltransferase [uncultured Thermomicrobiales bacterium]|uniref:CDP-diacylglycerol--serine O-phosphatidyltransferase n=1 Tax=uncultured Thermomicrobiales bacterium TaxID=1645740 RepID=A0A6J4VYA5_9BACT|nr:MAG: CDP-diacylglycerol--serine O-phosphatidyltransferase [uncultured Thermomicrobiales bacterium]
MKGKVRRGCEQIPNVITFCNLLCGVAAIMLVMDEHFLLAPAVIFLAGILDVIDGALARRLRGADPFGESLDSLADIISFGIAPALIVYRGFLHHWPSLGWLVAGGYAVCGAWRLARFASSEKGPFFQGLPITMAGMSAAAFLFYPNFWSPSAVAAMTLILALLMVSHFRFPKIPMLLRPFPRPVRLAIIALLAFAAIAISPAAVLTALGLTYFAVALLENFGFWEAVADGPVGDAVARLRSRN